MSEPTTEYEQVLSDVFGSDWEMFLGAEGIIGGDEDETVLEDQRRVIALAEQLHPHLDDDMLNKVGDAWMQWFVCASDPPFGSDPSDA